MRESLRIFVYILGAFMFAIAFAFFIINGIFSLSYFVWIFVLIGFIAIFSTSFVILVETKD